jgi:glutamate-1-semialdehyde aminotransferase
MLDGGVLLAPGPLSHNRLCAAFSDDDVDDTVEAARRAFAAVV